MDAIGFSTPKFHVRSELLCSHEVSHAEHVRQVTKQVVPVLDNFFLHLSLSNCPLVEHFPVLIVMFLVSLIELFLHGKHSVVGVIGLATLCNLMVS